MKTTKKEEKKEQTNELKVKYKIQPETIKEIFYCITFATIIMIYFYLWQLKIVKVKVIVLLKMF